MRKGPGTNIEALAAVAIQPTKLGKETIFFEI